MHIPHPAKSRTPAYATAHRSLPATGGGQDKIGVASIQRESGNIDAYGEYQDFTIIGIGK
jgi:hypothetical protein